MQKRVMICEDEPILRDLIASHLRASSFAVTMSKDGVECIQQLQIQRHDLLLLDLNLPTMSGVAVLRKLKDLASDIQVVVITASTDKAKINEVQELGVFSVLSKPFHLTSLVSEINKSLA